MLFGSTLSIHMQSFVEFFVTENGQTIWKWVWVCVWERKWMREMRPSKGIKLEKNCEAILILSCNFVRCAEVALETTSVQIRFRSENGKSFSYNISPLFSRFLLQLLLLLFLLFIFPFTSFLYLHYTSRSLLTNWICSSCTRSHSVFFLSLSPSLCVRSIFFLRASFADWLADDGFVMVYMLHGQTFSYRYLCSIFLAKVQVRSVSIWMMALN